MATISSVTATSTKQKWREDNKERIREYNRRWIAKNRERLAARARERYKDDPQPAKNRIKTYRQRHPSKRYEQHLKEKYGLSLEQYERKLEAQGGVCAICGERPSHPTKQRLCVDHNHHTGQIRGLLCDKHNRVIGLLGDDVAMLEKAIEYLRIWLPIAA